MFDRDRACVCVCDRERELSAIGIVYNDNHDDDHPCFSCRYIGNWLISMSECLLQLLTFFSADVAAVAVLFVCLLSLDLQEREIQTNASEPQKN